MKINLDTVKKTVQLEGDCKVSSVFNYLMSWFPEDWEAWTFVTTPIVTQQTIYVDKTIYRNPYWSPLNPFIYNVGDDPSPIPNVYCANTGTTSVSLDFNQISNL